MKKGGHAALFLSESFAGKAFIGLDIFGAGAGDDLGG
jgi:hypothetical protein